MNAHAKPSESFVACIPHVPLLERQENRKDASPGFWKAYDALVAEFDAFDPEIIIQFGSDHYSNIHLNMMPAFMVGFNAEGIDDCGGRPGKLDVPTDLAIDLAHDLVKNGFDIATSYAMKVDHGFTNALNFFLHGKIGARKVIPVFINAMAEPRPELRRCRLLGEAIGVWAAKLGKRVAFIGSGGLSHETGTIFPQYHNAPNEQVRDFITHGGLESGISDQKWHQDITNVIDFVTDKIFKNEFESSVKPAWDDKFLKALTSGDLTGFDQWADMDIVRDGGQGGSEVRMWIAAAAAGQAAGAGKLVLDYYSGDDTFGVGAGVVRSPRLVTAAE